MLPNNAGVCYAILCHAGVIPLMYPNDSECVRVACRKHIITILQCSSTFPIGFCYFCSSTQVQGGARQL
jgi:hypothetical protein